MASGEAEPLQYTTTVLRVSIHCEGCKKKVKKVLSIEGVYKVTVDAVQHKVTVTGSVGADALIRRLHKSGKQASLWPVPAAAAGEGKKKPAEAPPSAVEDASKPEAAAESSERKPEKDKGTEKKPEKGETKKPKDDEAKLESEISEKKKKGSPSPAKEAVAEDAGGEETGGKKGKKKKNKQKDAGAGDAAAESPPPQPQSQPLPHQAMPVPAPAPALGPDRMHGGFPFYPAQPVMSYNVAQPSASVSYYAPSPVVSMQPMTPPPPPPHMPYGFSPYPPMEPPPEFMYGPPGIRSSTPPQESYNNMFNEENPNSCRLM